MLESQRYGAHGAVMRGQLVANAGKISPGLEIVWFIPMKGVKQFKALEITRQRTFRIAKARESWAVLDIAQFTVRNSPQTLLLGVRGSFLCQFGEAMSG